jgi:photosystem II stability/assembly factor-like uncharacterized protein
VNPQKNDFAIAEEVTLRGNLERRPDLVLYVNGIAIAVIELKNSHVSIGDGIYKTIDGGDTWQHLGLAGSERIAEIRIDPRASDTVYACVTGRLWSDSLERGVYRTRDGGANWTKVLAGVNATSGANDLAMDPTNPRILYAAFWDHQREPWYVRSGGTGRRLPSRSSATKVR